MTTEELVLDFVPRGAIRELGWLNDPEIVIEGPAGTGKTFGILHLLHRIQLENPGCRGLMVRKTLTSLTDTALVTLREKVLNEQEPVTWFGGSRFEPASLRYNNGSRIVVGGMDNPSKFLSGEYDWIYFNECQEGSEEDWETLTTRLRNGVLKHPRILGDNNPTYERHWLYKRPQIRWLHSTHADNPTITPEYLETLKRLTGTRYQRFYLGQRIGLENAIYPQCDGSQLVEMPEKVAWTGRGATGVDFGRVHLSAVVSVTQATDGIWWVRECWAENGGNAQAIEDACRSQRQRFKVSMGVTDPIQEVLAQKLGYRIAKSGAGSRKGRISAVTKLLDAGALRFDVYGEGVRDLYEEMCMYRYEIRETDTVIEDVVVRKDDDRVAAFEYAVEGTETGKEYGSLAGLGGTKPYASQTYRGI